MSNALIQVMLSKAEDQFSIRDQRALGLSGFGKRDDRRSFLLGLIADAAQKFSELKNLPKLVISTGAIGDGTIIQAILDWISSLEPGTVKEFIAFLFEQLPILIKNIVDIFV